MSLFLHIRTIFLHIPYDLLRFIGIHCNCNEYRYRNITQWVVGKTPHRASRTFSWKAKVIYINPQYLGLLMRLLGSENNTFVQWLAMNTPARQWFQTYNITIFNRGHHSPCSICLEESKQPKSWFQQSKQWERWIPEIPRQVSTEVRGYNIPYETKIRTIQIIHPWTAVVWILLTSGSYLPDLQSATPSSFQHWKNWTSFPLT